MLHKWQLVIVRWCVSTSEIGVPRLLMQSKKFSHVARRLLAASRASTTCFVELFVVGCRLMSSTGLPVSRSRLTKMRPSSPSNRMPLGKSMLPSSRR